MYLLRRTSITQDDDAGGWYQSPRPDGGSEGLSVSRESFSHELGRGYLLLLCGLWLRSSPHLQHAVTMPDYQTARLPVLPVFRRRQSVIYSPQDRHARITDARSDVASRRVGTHPSNVRIQLGSRRCANVFLYLSQGSLSFPSPSLNPSNQSTCVLRPFVLSVCLSVRPSGRRMGISSIPIGFIGAEDPSPASSTWRP